MPIGLGGAALILGASGVGATALGSFLGRQKGEGLTRDDFFEISRKRQAQIGSFLEDLAATRAKFRAQLPQIRQRVFDRFLPNLEARFAGRGLQVSGGAFGSAVGRAATDFETQALQTLNDQEREDIRLGLTATAGINPASLGLPFTPSRANPAAGALGQLGGTLIGAGIGAGLQRSRNRAALTQQDAFLNRLLGRTAQVS